ncbi:MAG: malto-oligosyltrehalose synthase, partial [Candidatus Melainabacteria bacterium]|nr:malto-oligosyltrehalose synthase [Candidatus Melainabacteria bacterium]
MNTELSTPTINVRVVQSCIAGPRIPSATYRLQFHSQFTFRDATNIVAYLHALGISDCYASPYLQAAPGSSHGYDINDHNVLNPEVGSAAEYSAWVAVLQRYDMGQLLDLVPNHMGIAGGHNPWWLDVLENGPSSPYASFFDIDWHSRKHDLENKVLLPILGDQYGRVLENQDLHVKYEAGAFVLVVYGKERLPIAPRSMAQVLTYRLDVLEQQLGVDHPAYVELQSILTALSHLPLRTETEAEKVRERQREKEVIKRRLATLTTEYAVIGDFLAENLRQFNGEKGVAQSFDRLDALLADQAYRLAYWRVAAEEINYRRFFDVNALVGLCAENSAVFAATHQFVLRLVAEGKVNGFRVDHIDGLYDPTRYLHRLQQACAVLRNGLDHAQLADVLHSTEAPEKYGSDDEQGITSDAKPCYIICEKILNADERLPDAWPIHGTSGYDFLSLVNGLFIDPRGERPCTEIYQRFTKTHVRFADLVYDSKKLIMQVALSSELNVLAQQLSTLAATHRYSRDFTPNLLRHALREIVACFPVYRTYIDHSGVTPVDRVIIEQAVTRARRRNPATDTSVFDFVRDVLLLNVPEPSDGDRRHSYRAFVMKFQQYTGPVMAKGFEDTAFYRYHRLVSLNEVGGT